MDMKIGPARRDESAFRLYSADIAAGIDPRRDFGDAAVPADHDVKRRVGYGLFAEADRLRPLEEERLGGGCETIADHFRCPSQVAGREGRGGRRLQAAATERLARS